MKIYNKKGFWQGIFYLCLTGFWMYTCSYEGLTLRNGFLCAFGLFIGIYYLSRSFSRNLSEADQDERSKLIIQKSRCMAFLCCKGICILLGIFWLVLYTYTKSDIHMAMFISFMFMLIGMVFAEAITEIYYDAKL